MVKLASFSAPDAEYRVMRDGVALAVDTAGPQAGPTVICAHGFGQNRHIWHRLTAGMAADGWHTLAFDARGHGDSGRTANGAYRMDQFVDDLAAIARQEPVPRVLVGASMGGLLGLVVAGELDPALFSALILVDITPRWEAAGVARILAFMRAHADGFADLEEAVTSVVLGAPGAPRERAASEMAPLLRQHADGRLYFHWDPALLDTVAINGEQHQARLERAAKRLHVPVLLVSGGASDVVSDATINEFLGWVPQARHVRIPGAAHRLAGAAGDELLHAMRDFLAPLFPSMGPARPAER